MDYIAQSVRMLITADALFHLLPIIIKLLIVKNDLGANQLLIAVVQRCAVLLVMVEFNLIAIFFLYLNKLMTHDTHYI